MKEKNSQKLKKTKKKKLRSIFLKVVIITFAVCLFLVGGAFAAYRFMIYDDGGKQAAGSQTIKPKLFPKEKDINETLAVFGVDKEGYRTDVIFVVNYNSKTNKVKVVSVPRDTKVEWSESQQQRLKELKDMTRTESKLNEMTSYGGIENIRSFTIDEIEHMLGVNIDNYVIITTDAFRKIVDAIGGVEVDVPVLDGQGLQYDDSAQNLHIHLSPGLQKLNGSDAEGLVRFRKGYAEGDVGRIKTQQLFLKAFAEKVLSPGTITRLPQIIPVIFTCVKTDMSLTEIPQYYSHIKKFNLSNLTFNIIPGEPQHVEGKWYFMRDTEKMKAFVDEVFYDKPAVTSSAAMTTEAAVIDKTVSVEVLNAANIKGAAGTVKDKLESAGYNVASIDNYSDGNLPNTVIYAKDLAKANQFKRYFTNASVEQKTDINYDIQIILGEDIQ